MNLLLTVASIIFHARDKNIETITVGFTGLEKLHEYILSGLNSQLNDHMTSFPVNFRFNRMLKISFSKIFIAPKDSPWNFRGVSRAILSLSSRAWQIWTQLLIYFLTLPVTTAMIEKKIKTCFFNLFANTSWHFPILKLSIAIHRNIGPKWKWSFKRSNQQSLVQLCEIKHVPSQ